MAYNRLGKMMYGFATISGTTVVVMIIYHPLENVWIPVSFPFAFFVLVFLKGVLSRMIGEDVDIRSKEVSGNPSNYDDIPDL